MKPSSQQRPKAKAKNSKRRPKVLVSPTPARKQRVRALKDWVTGNKACTEILAKNAAEEGSGPSVTPQLALVDVWDVSARTTKTGWAEVHMRRPGQDDPCLTLSKGGGKGALCQATMPTWPESARPGGPLTALALAIVAADPPLLALAKRIEGLGLGKTAGAQKKNSSPARPPSRKKQKTNTGSKKPTHRKRKKD